jgi:hypothetical protein
LDAAPATLGGIDLMPMIKQRQRGGGEEGNAGLTAAALCSSLAASSPYGHRGTCPLAPPEQNVRQNPHVRTLNGELGAIFTRWYPDMDLEVEEIPVAA